MFAWPSFLRRKAASITRMQTKHTGAAARLHALSFARGWSEEEMAALILDPQVEAQALVRSTLLRGQTVDGFVLSRLAVDEAEILTIAIDPDQRGQGLGRKLLSNHLARLGARGITVLFLEVEQDNTLASALYARAGFVEVGRRPAYYTKPDGTRSEALVLKRDLG